ncbi:hypothetical protein HDV05_002241 [Chytridiales sp. JEL 0842]|nr:hypothetical protein HDV05_002241 [Chytridiales sp. JEL 0842]
MDDKSAHEITHSRSLTSTACDATSETSSDISHSNSEINPQVSIEEKREIDAHLRVMPQGCIFAANLNSSRTDEQLYESVYKHFSQWGELQSVKVERDEKKTKPFAFIQFVRIADAKRALLESPNTIIDNRAIRVEKANVHRTLFIHKFGKAMTYDQIYKLLEQFGPVEDLTLLHLRNRTETRGPGFVKFFTREDAIKAFLQLKRQYKWTVDWSTNVNRQEVEIDKSSIFVGKINQEAVTIEALREKFGRYGAMEVCQLVNKFPFGPGARPAFAFIRYVESESAELAIQEENGTRWLDKIIKVQYREKAYREALAEARMEEPPSPITYNMPPGSPAGFFPSNFADSVPVHTFPRHVTNSYYPDNTQKGFSTPPFGAALSYLTPPTSPPMAHMSASNARPGRDNTVQGSGMIPVGPPMAVFYPGVIGPNGEVAMFYYYPHSGAPYPFHPGPAPLTPGNQQPSSYAYQRGGPNPQPMQYPSPAMYPSYGYRPPTPNQNQSSSSEYSSSNFH